MFPVPSGERVPVVFALGRVLTVPAVDSVIASTTKKGIATTIPHDFTISFATSDQIRAKAAIDLIVAFAANSPFCLVRPNQLDFIVAVAAAHCIIAKSENGVVPSTTKNTVSPLAAVEFICFVTAL